MIRRSATLALFVAAPAAAQDWREPGTVFHVCRAEHRLPAFTAPYGNPRLASRGRGGKIDYRPVREGLEETFTASAEVDPDGSLRNIVMDWHRPTEMWPYQWLTELHPLHIRATMMRERLPAGAADLFDAAALDLLIQYRSERRLRGPWLFRLSSDGHGPGRAEIKLLAQNQVRGLALQVRWGVIEALAPGQPRLRYVIEKPVYGAPAGEGIIELSRLPAVFAAFTAVEAKLREAIGRAPQGCTREIEPEPPDDAFIAPTATR